MPLLSVVLSFLLAALGLGVAAFAAVFLKLVRNNSEKAMASFQLHPEETVSEFRMLYFGLILEFTAFVIYGVGGLLNEIVLLNLARTISVVFILVGMKISLNWWRRFS